MSVLNFILLFSSFLLMGCVPFPHTSERLHAVHGHVIDAATGSPVSGADVVLQGHPNTKTQTDVHGEFHFSKRRNYHFLLVPGICGLTDWPGGSEWSTTLDI